MFHVIENILTENDLQTIYAEVGALEFEDGKRTAGRAARKVKNVLQAKGFNQTLAMKLMQNKLRRNEQFRLCAAPLRLSTIMLSKYEVGMEYGHHTDNAIMESGAIRADLAFTVFLSDPGTYDGGELEVSLCDHADESPALEYKLSAGSALVYPAIFRHRVKPVRSGQRLVAVGWAQSMIRDHHKREIIRELSIARDALFSVDGKSIAFDGMGNALSNLVRMWAEN